MVQVAVAYILLVLAVALVVKHTHPQRAVLYVIAVLPAIAVLRMIHVVALYLQELKDEYLARQLVNSILLGAAAVLAVNAVSDFLRSFAGTGVLPEFTLFLVFWGVMGLAEIVQTRQILAAKYEE
jgi:hypothetical protein